MTSDPVSRRGAVLRIEGVGMAFASSSGPVSALCNIDLEVSRGEFVSLVGPPGSGKSTLLNLVAGLLMPTAGRILVEGRLVQGPGPDRPVVCRNHSLLPWLSCLENVLLAVERARQPGDTSARLHERARAALGLAGLSKAAERRSGDLSGAMMLRLGLARALAMEPAILLLDEPFAHLDQPTRAELHDVLGGVLASRASNVLMVTRDADEAVLMSDRIVLLSDGPAATVREILDLPWPAAARTPGSRLGMAHEAAFRQCRGAVLAALSSGSPAVAALAV